MRKTFLVFFVLLATGVFGQSETSHKALLNGLRARHIGPAVMSGRISDIDVVHKKPEIIYVGTAGGGVWKTVSGGAHIRPVFDEYTMSIGKVTIDQNHPDTVWVGTGESWVRNSVGVGTGVYKTTNGGTSWEFVGLGESEHISNIIVHPKDGNIVYVAAQGKLWAPHKERGVYKTTDGGKTWTQVLFVDENTGCADLAIDPANPETVYAAMWSHRRYPDFFDSGFTGTSALYKSTDGGKSWTKIHNGLPAATLGRMAIAVAPTNSSVIYLTVEAKAKEHKGLYKSTDAGAHWKKINDDFNITVRPFYFARLVADPTNDSTIAKCGLFGIISTDGGKKFRAFPGSVHSDYHSIWINPRNNKHIIAGTDGGVYESVDGGYSFRMWMNLPVGQFYHVSIDNEKPYNIYGGLQDNGSWYGPSQKAGGISNSDWKTSFGGDGFWSFRHPEVKDIIFSEYQGGNLVRYNTTTGTAKDIKPYPEKNEPKFRFNWNTPIHISPNNSNRMYFGAQFLFMSEDMGDTWRRLSGDLTTNDPKRQRQDYTGGLSIDKSSAENNTTIYAIAESPKDEKTIWVGTDDGNLQLTTNQGATWTNVAPAIVGLPKFAWCSSVEPSHFDKQTAYVTFDHHRAGDMAPYIYKTTDLGKTWTSLVTTDIQGHVYVIKEDLVNPNLLFAGTEFGLFISLDGGKRWTRFENNFPKVAVHDMVIHPTEHALVTATHGRGILIIDDITPLRQVNGDVLASSIHFFETKPTILRDPGAGSNWFGGDGNFVGENPNRNAKIIYYLNKRHTFGKMSVEVYDQSGKLLRELPAGKSAGINVVEMPTSLERPRAAPSDDPQALFGSFQGPNLAEGTYKVKVIKGKDEFWADFSLQYSENSPYTAEDRKIQRETTMRLYHLTEKVAYLYYAQEDLIRQLKTTLQQNEKMGKRINPVLKEIETLLNALVFKGGDFYINTDQKLGERISELYGQVSSFPGRPSSSQIARTTVLEGDLNKVIEKFDLVKKDKLLALNQELTRNKLTAITVMTEEEFRTKETTKGGTASPGNLQWLQRIQF
jgi:photosystem II stability/assembly factor-like uncharacterized protein